MKLNYIPRPQQPVVAAQAAEDLVVPAGDWVTITSEGTITQWTDKDFRATFVMAPVAPEPESESAPEEIVAGPREKAPRKIRKPTKISGRVVANIFRVQAGRMFYYLRSIGRPARTPEVWEAILDERDKTKSTISACLCILRDMGYVTSEKSGWPEIGNIWAVTEKGIAAADQFGVECFTRYSMQVPPDRYTSRVPPPASRLAEAWQERHNA